MHHDFEVRISGAEAPGDHVPTTLGDFLAVSEDIELTGLAGSDHRLDSKMRSDESHETRDFGLIVLSRRAADDLDSHPVALGRMGAE